MALMTSSRPHNERISHCPKAVAHLLRCLPLTPIAIAGQRLVESVACRHPSLFDRLGDQARKTYLIELTDIPLSFLIAPSQARPALDVLRDGRNSRWEARIAGPMAALIGLLHGKYDGDALFFSRDIVVEGDTEAILALRNALDDAEIDLISEIAALLAPFDRLLRAPLHRLSPVVERLSGLALSRGERAKDL